jgi:HEAT repeat protein
MNRFLSLAFLLLIGAVATSATPTVIAPTQQHATAVALIVDQELFDRVQDPILAYRDAIEQDNLSASIVVDDWQDPDAVKAAILDVADMDIPLEGVVLIGDIPIPMIRDAQHLTSAFKMDQNNPKRFPMIDSSVPSDRFYDDWDLEFTFIKQDSAHPNLFYYSLTADSPQTIDREIYSARIIAPVQDDSRYALIASYLNRVAEQKSKDNPFDNMLTFAGHGYHSESLNAWEGELLSLREQFPMLYRPDGTIKNLYHTMDTELKEIILIELSRQNLDFALFHAHGAEDTQYLLGNPPAKTLSDHVEVIQEYMRSRLRYAKRRERSLAEAKLYYMEKYDLPLNWFENAFTDSVRLADSLANAKMDISIQDIESISPGAKVIMFDECFNGAFIRSPFVAGAYLFNDGKTVTGIANTVNVAQDIWANEFLGTIGLGMRIGNWHKTCNYLESHIIGDPTFRFSSDVQPDVNEAFVLKASDVEFWNQALTREHPSWRSLAVYMLYNELGSGLDDRLVEIYKTDPSFVVRMEALACLADLRSDNFYEILNTTITDPYEFIRRCTVQWMGDAGREEYLPLLVRQMLYDPSKRISFRGKTAMEKIGLSKAHEYHIAAIDSMPDITSKEKLEAILTRSAERSKEWLNDDLIPTVLNDSLSVKKRISSVRTFRNYRFQDALPTLITVAGDSQQPEQLRVAVLEALGWFTMSASRDTIVAACQDIIDRSTAPDAVRQEALKTKRRLIQGPNDSITP